MHAENELNDPNWAPWQVGDLLFIRTVTYAVTGRLVAIGKQELVFLDAAWVSDTGRYMGAVETGVFKEVEPYPHDRPVVVGRAAIIDATEIPQLPRDQK